MDRQKITIITLSTILTILILSQFILPFYNQKIEQNLKQEIADTLIDSNCQGSYTIEFEYKNETMNFELTSVECINAILQSKQGETQQ